MVKRYGSVLCTSILNTMLDEKIISTSCRCMAHTLASK